MAYKVTVHRLPMNAPDDVEPLRRLIDSEVIRAEDIISIICKTEGNGRMNDFTRAFATMAFKSYFTDQLGISPEEVTSRVALVMSGGCEGVMTPHATVFARSKIPGDSITHEKRLAVGVAFTRDLMSEEVGRMGQVNLVAEATSRAMEQAGIIDPKDVHYVQTKGPLLTTERINDATTRKQTVVTMDPYKSMGFSNGSSALGVGLALNEIPPEHLSDDVICRREDLFSSVASCSAGVEMMNCHIVVVGNTPDSASELVAGHALLQDLIDVEGVISALGSVGLTSSNKYPSPEELDLVEAVFVKALTPPNGELRGNRTTLLTDLDLGTRPARAVGNAVIASIIGDPMIYVSAGWGYHQGPVGGGVVAIIARLPVGEHLTKSYSLPA